MQNKQISSIDPRKPEKCNNIVTVATYVLIKKKPKGAWAPCRWFLLLGHMGVAFIECRLSMLILFIIFFGKTTLHPNIKNLTNDLKNKLIWFAKLPALFYNI
jgi:hypothetical protein